MNRILRFVQRPAGVYHFSVFHQFSGGFGPSSLACDRDGNLYVAHFDPVQGPQESTSITVLTPKGEKKASIQIPGAEVTGMVFNALRAPPFPCFL